MTDSLKAPTTQKKPIVFIGSSQESRRRGLVAHLITMIDDAFTVRPWYDVFPTGSLTLEALLRVAHEVDAAVLIFGRDDQRDHRGQSSWMTRDNVILEYGLFLGTLPRDRVWILEEEGVELPSDVAGLSTVKLPSEPGAGQEAEIERCAGRMKDKWGQLSSLASAGTSRAATAGLGFAQAIDEEQAHIGRLAAALRAHVARGREGPLFAEPIVFDSSRIATAAYSEALDQVHREYRRTTLLRSGFWTHPNAETIEATARMLQRLRSSGGSAQLLFVLDDEPDRVAETYKQHRILQRKVQKHAELDRLNSELSNLEGSVKHLRDQGLEVRVAFDGNRAFHALPAGMITDPDDCELALYDDFRVDLFEGGRSAVIARMKCYSPLSRNFHGYRSAATQYFQTLWEGAQPVDVFLAKLDAVVEEAEAKIDYSSNWLAIYEFALNKVDENLKIVEMKRVEEILRRREKWGVTRRYLDVGTYTGRYPIQMRDAVADDGYILGIDEDYDCVRFARSTQDRVCPKDARIEITQCDFTALDALQQLPFDLVTCMQGRLSHFGWDRKVHEPVGGSLQRALHRMSRLLADDGLLILATWSRYACDNHQMLGIYSDSDRKRLADWTPTREELRVRLGEAELKVVEEHQPDLRLDFTVCQHA